MNFGTSFSKLFADCECVRVCVCAAASAFVVTNFSLNWQFMANSRTTLISRSPHLKFWTRQLKICG